MPRRRGRRPRRSTVAEGIAILGLALGLYIWTGGGSMLLSGLTNPVILIVLTTAIGGAIYLAMRYYRRRRLRHRTLLELLGLTPTRFELAIADLLRDVGYRDVQRVGRRGDLAADIMCRDRRGRSVVVQCKRYAPGQRIGSPEIQRFIGMVAVHHRADYGMFVTTAKFTEPAQRLAKQHGIELYDDERLTALLTRTFGDRGRPRGADAAMAEPSLHCTRVGRA